MTDLQMSLIAAGGVFVVAVISYNKWQEYKAKKSVERAFSTSHDDVLMNPGNKIAPTMRGADTGASERKEPTLPDSAPPNAKTAKGEKKPPATMEQDLSQAQDGAAQTEAMEDIIPQRAAPAVALPIDTLIDCIIPLNTETPLRGEKILPVLHTLRHVGNKPVHYIGMRQKGGWEPIAHGGVYTALQAGVQLASRSKALNELEYSELVMRLRQVTDEIGAEPEVPDMIDVMERARSLHQFVTEHDAQLGVNIHSNGAPWAISTLLIALEKQGFDLRPDGRFVMPDGEGRFLFSMLTNVTLAAETTSRLTLLLDVPCVSAENNGFGAMVACAKSLVLRLDGTIVDDGNQPLSDVALGEIDLQVKAFYQDMQRNQIPAGSNRALRLFG